LVSHPNFKDDPSACHLFVIMDAGAGQVTIGKNQLFPRKRFDPCCFKTNIFNYPTFVINGNKIPNLEWPVKEYDKVVENISNNILCCQCNGNPSYPKTCNNSGHIISKVVQKKKNPNGPDKNIDNNHYS